MSESRNVGGLQNGARADILSGLASLGLTSYEASTFYAIVTSPGRTAAELCKESGIPDSKIYHTLGGLERRGMIEVQRGRPKLYRALRPTEAMENLRRVLNEEHARRLNALEGLTAKLTALHQQAEGEEELELAYIVRGLRGIVSKMNAIIRSARQSLLLFIPSVEIWNEIQGAIVEVADRGVRVELALAKGVELKPSLLPGSFRELDCGCCILLADGRTMLNVTDWSSMTATAILTQEPNLIRFTREYYNNPACCPRRLQDKVVIPARHEEEKTS
jgi:sugar-specific transcriptional regulator TrmB